MTPHSDGPPDSMHALPPSANTATSLFPGDACWLCGRWRPVRVLTVSLCWGLGVTSDALVAVVVDDDA